MNPRRAGLAAILAALLAGCASSEGLTTRSTPADPAGLAAARALAGAPVAKDAMPADEWWKALGDPQLDALVAEALAASPSLRLARARVDRALALAESAGAALRPQVSARVDSSRQRISEHYIFPPPLAGSWDWQNQALLDFSYEFDFWGRNGAAQAAALGQAKAAEADAHAAALVLSSAVALAYVQLSRTFDQLDLARALLQQRDEQLTLVHERLAAGLDSRVELKQAEASLPESRQRIVQLEEAIALSRHQLAALLGKGPDRGGEIARPALRPEARLALPSRLPADLLGRRPDIVASRWRVEAAARDIDSARAEFYPNVNLVAFIGLQALGWSQILDAGSRVLGAGPALRLPVFDAGRLRGNLGAKNADYDAAVEQYNQSLADALRDVADQVTAWRSIERQDTEVAEGLAAAQAAHDLAMARFRAGLSSYLSVLAADGQLTAQQGLAAELRARRLEAAIGLSRALGGGYSGKGPEHAAAR
jgi:NodT family efflux transporter outer membrane factor (OMF) lipoprotein